MKAFTIAHVVLLTSVADLESRTAVRLGGKYHGTGHGNDSEDNDDYETISSGGMSDAKSRFTDYSLSSSVVPRNEGMPIYRCMYSVPGFILCMQLVSVSLLARVLSSVYVHLCAYVYIFVYLCTSLFICVHLCNVSVSYRNATIRNKRNKMFHQVKLFINS